MTNFDIKKTLFTMSGLGLIALIIIFVRAYNVDASIKAGQVFGDWVIGCEKDEKNEEVCFISQVISTKDPKDEKKEQHLATFRIGYFGKPKELRFIQVLPFGTSLQPGTSIIVDKNKLIAPGKFTTCQNFGCIAIAVLKDKDLADLANAKDAEIGIMTLEGKQVNIKLSTNGIKDGVAALK